MVDWLSGQKQRSAKPSNRQFKSDIHLCVRNPYWSSGRDCGSRYVRIRIPSNTYLRGEKVSHRSHKPSVSVAGTDPATKKDLEYFVISIFILIFVKENCGVVDKSHVSLISSRTGALPATATNG